MFSGQKCVRWVCGAAAVALIALPAYAIFESLNTRRCMQVVKSMEAGKVTLSSAIASAETKSKGKAIAAYSEIEDGKLFFDVFCLAENKIMWVEVDGTGVAGEVEEVSSVPIAEEPEEAPKPKPIRGG